MPDANTELEGRALAAELAESGADGSAGEANDSGIGAVEFEDHEHGAGNRSGGNEQTGEHGGIARSEQAEGEKNYRDPEDKGDQQRNGNGNSLLRILEPARLADAPGDGGSLGF